MLSAAIPFVRERLKGVEDTTLRKIHSYARTVKKLKSYYEIPAFEVENVWRGASEIIYRFDFDIGLLSLLTNFPEAPSDATFCPVVSWRVGEEFVRYKLWENVGEILWLPKYNKEKINASTFYIEIWNTNTQEGGTALGLESDDLALGTEDGLGLGLEDSGTFLNIILAEAIRLYTTRLVIPTDFCNEDDVLLGSPTVCVDPIYHLSLFQPLFGDYYLLVAPCERELIKGIIAEPTYNLLQSTDDTWHYVWTDLNEDGDIVLSVDQTNAVPPADALGYFAIISVSDSTIYRIALQVMPDEGATQHAISIRGTLTADETTKANLVLLENLTNSQKYGIYIGLEESAPDIKIYQTAIVI